MQDVAHADSHESEHRIGGRTRAALALQPCHCD